jgi:hypothetical protein
MIQRKKSMAKAMLIGIGALVAAAAGAFAITRDGSMVTPQGSGKVTTASGSFEGFPLPDYAQKFVTDDYKSYLIEVEPGIKVHVLEVGEGYPVFMQHGNPTSGFLYRKVVEDLPLEVRNDVQPAVPVADVTTGATAPPQLSNVAAVAPVDWIAQLTAEVGRRLLSGTPQVMDALTRDFEATVIRTALRHTHGRRIDAATRLGVGRNTITRKIQDLGLEE